MSSRIHAYRFIDSLPETCSEVVLPLKIEERVLGVLDVQSDQPHAFHPNDLLILGALADTIARAVEGARLYSDLRRRADQLALVAEVSKSVSSSLELKTLMNNVAALIHERFGYPYVHLFTVHRNRRLIEYRSGERRHAAGIWWDTHYRSMIPKGSFPGWRVKDKPSLRTM